VLSGRRWGKALFEELAQAADDLFDVTERVGVARQPLLGHHADGLAARVDQHDRRLIGAVTKFVRPDCARPTAATCGLSARLTNAGP
jgi:hypothetical protein